jgi:hypothetical protein
LWNSVTPLAFVIVLWAFALSGWSPRSHPLAPLTAIWIAAAMIALVWVFWRCGGTKPR